PPAWRNALHGPLSGAVHRPHPGERAHAARRLMTTGLNLDYTLFIPEYLLVGLVVLVVVADLYVPQVKKAWLSYIAAAGLAAVALVSLAWVNKHTDFAGIVSIDNYTT